MKRYLSFVALIVLACTGVAHGHAHVQKSEPVDNSTVSQLPRNFVLEFDKPALLTALTLQKGDAKVRDLGPLPDAAAKTVTVPMPAVEPGSYIINWRAMGDDGHVVSGKVLFTFAPAVSRPQ